jgi:hypothetical protein
LRSLLLSEDEAEAELCEATKRLWISLTQDSKAWRTLWPVFADVSTKRMLEGEAEDER